MGLFKFLKKSIDNKNKNNIIKDDSSYVNTQVIYNAANNLIILFSFSKNYFFDAIEFLSSLNGINNINVKFIHSSYEEGIDENIIIHDKYYILIGGNSSAYCEIYNKIDNIANEFLTCLSLEICNHRPYTEFKSLDSSIFFQNQFKYKNTIPVYDEPTYYKKDLYKYIDKNALIMSDDIKHIMSRLPSGFTGQNLLKFVYCYMYNFIDRDNEIISAYDFLSNVYSDNKSISDKYKLLMDAYGDLFKSFTSNPSDNVYKNFIGPQYLVQDDDSIPGDVSDESLDEIFRQQYDRFNAIKSNDVVYEDIDEELAEDNNDNI